MVHKRTLLAEDPGNSPSSIKVLKRLLKRDFSTVCKPNLHLNEKINWYKRHLKQGVVCLEHSAKFLVDVPNNAVNSGGFLPKTFLWP